MVLVVVDGYFDDMVLLVFEDAVCFFDLRERETVGDERSVFYLALDWQGNVNNYALAFAESFEKRIFAIKICVMTQKFLINSCFLNAKHI